MTPRRVAAVALGTAIWGPALLPRPSEAAEGDVVIAEVMPSPACAADPAAEWFELYNTTATTIALEGWGAGREGAFTSLPAMTLPAHGRVVVCAEGDPSLNGGVVCDGTISALALESSDRLILRDADGAGVDEVSWLGAGWPVEAGRSMALRDGALDSALNDFADSWCASVDPVPGGCGDFGSPGAPNADLDRDEDGACDAVDPCVDVDGDGAGTPLFGGACADDSDDGDPSACHDLDGDGCDDCSTGTGDPGDDGPDADGDGVCDASDLCVGADPFGDLDSDGLCNDLDTDDDDDGWIDANEVVCGTDPLDPLSRPTDGDLDGICDTIDPSTCGNAAVEVGESCDDGDVVPGDGCSATCTLEGSAAAPGDVVVTEMMLRPTCSAADQGEWVELENVSGADLDLSGWRLLTQSGSAWGFPDHLLLAAGATLVVCADDRPEANGGVSCAAGWSGIGLADTVGSLEVLDWADTQVDAVAWNGGGGWSLAPGRALALAPGVDAAGNDAASAWCPASAAVPGGCGDAGSPGAPNAMEDLDLDGRCDYADTCYDADGDGAGDPAWPGHACQDDADDLDAFACNDSDSDGCDDCAAAGSDQPADDGPDADGDGICDGGDPCVGANPTGDLDLDGLCGDVDDDDDGDGWLDADEGTCGTDPADPLDYPVDEDGNGVCDSIENPLDSDGDGWTDEEEAACGTSPTDPTEYPRDRDADGFTDCDGDCDDLDPDVHPGAFEEPYNDRDEDCDGVDLADVDEDGWESTEAGGLDCDDSNAAVNPAADERCDDMIDNDCDGTRDGSDSQCGGGEPDPDPCACAHGDPAGASGAALLVVAAALHRRRRAG